MKLNNTYLFHLFTAAILAVLAGACTRKPDPIPDRHHVKSKTELYAFLDTLERRYEVACVARGRGEWNRILHGSRPQADSSAAIFASIFGDTAASAIITEWRAQSSSLADKPLARRLELWHRCFMGGEVETNPAIAALRDSVGRLLSGFMNAGMESPSQKLSAALRGEKQSKLRRSIWARQQDLSAAIRPKLLRLIRLQNAAARTAGFPNYFSLLLYLNTIDEEWLIKSLALMEEETNNPSEKAFTSLRRKIHSKKLAPWDIDFAVKEAPPAPDKFFPIDSSFSSIRRFEDYIGFDVDSLPIRTETADIPLDAAGVPVAIPSDTRLLLNKAGGRDEVAAAAREFGRSLKYALTRVDYPIQKGYGWIPGTRCEVYDNGLARVHAGFTSDSLWLVTWTKLNRRQIQRLLAVDPVPALVRLRMRLLEFTLGYELYKNPDLNSAQLERRLYKKFAGIETDSTADTTATGLWTAAGTVPAIISLLSDMAGAQILEALTSKFGERKIQDTTMAKWITAKCYATGETTEWTERMRNTTGKSLEPGPYLRSIGVEPLQLITRDTESDSTEGKK